MESAFKITNKSVVYFPPFWVIRNCSGTNRGSFYSISRSQCRSIGSGKINWNWHMFPFIEYCGLCGWMRTEEWMDDWVDGVVWRCFASCEGCCLLLLWGTEHHPEHCWGFFINANRFLKLNANEDMNCKIKLLVALLVSYAQFLLSRI